MKVIAILIVISFVIGTAYAQTPSTSTQEAGNDVIAVVLGKNLTTKDKKELDRIIVGSLLQLYAKENKVEPTAKEIDAFVLKTEKMKKEEQAREEEEKKTLMAELKSSTLSKQDREEKETLLEAINKSQEMTRQTAKQTKGIEDQMNPAMSQVAQQWVKTWKVNKALYAKYGGRVVFQQAGPEPLDAYRDFLKEQEKKGSFKILDKQCETSFWEYFTNDAKHNFYSKEKGEKAINTPWWMKESPKE